MMHYYIVIDKKFIDFVNIRIPVLFEGDLAHTANSYLKKNDRVHITGQILGDVIQSGANSDQAHVQLFKSFHGSFSHQVMVRDLHYIEGSKAMPKVLPTLDQNEGVLKHSGKRLAHHSRFFFFFTVISLLVWLFKIDYNHEHSSSCS